MKLSELATKVEGSYTMGNITLGHINTMLADKMPDGYSITQAKDYLAEEWHLGPGLTDSILLQASAMQSGGHLNSTSEVEAFLDAACDAYARANKITIPK